MELLESASRTLMSALQFGHSNKPVQYVPRDSKVHPLNASSSTTTSSSMSIQDFPAWASSTTGLPVSTLVVLTMILLYPIMKGIYNIYFHPLSKFPGPSMAAATKIPIAMVSWDGGLSHWLKELHEYYRSDVVRISPDELSFVGPSAWKDIYGSRPGHHEHFQKDLLIFSEVKGIVTANDADHTRMRRLLAHAFSEKALREQETLLQGYVNALVLGLKKQIDDPAKGKVCLSDWFMWMSFDIMGDFSFGESFNCLKDESYHPFVSTIVSGLKHIVFSSVTKRFPPLERILRLYVPKSLVNAREGIIKFASDKVDRRLETKTSRPDLMAYITKHNEGIERGGMTRDEVKDSAQTLIVAGSETTATFLSGCIYYLLKNPHCLENLHEEIRAFKRPEDINLQNVLSLQYYQAVIDEAFRMYPPALAGQPRIAPKGGDTVSGHFVPEGTGVQVNQYAMFHTRLNFNSPEIFAPSRWLGNEHFAKDKRETVQPFSIGGRNCIGKNLALAEIRLALAHLVWNFDIELDKETDDDWAYQKAWFTWEKKPLYVKLKVRKV